jgi:hypothetical protein
VRDAEFVKRNAVVETSCEVETYPSVPRPRVVEVRLAAPAAFATRNAVVDTREAVDT